VAMGAGLRPTTKGVEKPPDPKVRAPALDPTGATVWKKPACGNAGNGRSGPIQHTERLMSYLVLLRYKYTAGDS
jgi:hypothetical protein